MSILLLTPNPTTKLPLLSILTNLREIILGLSLLIYKIRIILVLSLIINIHRDQQENLHHQLISF